MIHPNTELRFISEAIGFGVFATEFIPKGTITWALDKLDQVMKPDVVAALPPIYKKILKSMHISLLKEITYFVGT